MWTNGRQAPGLPATVDQPESDVNQAISDFQGLLAGITGPECSLRAIRRFRVSSFYGCGNGLSSPHVVLHSEWTLSGYLRAAL